LGSGLTWQRVGRESGVERVESRLSGPIIFVEPTLHFLFSIFCEAFACNSVRGACGVAFRVAPLNRVVFRVARVAKTLRFCMTQEVDLLPAVGESCESRGRSTAQDAVTATGFKGGNLRQYSGNSSITSD
jgi:hypothetical protein